MLTGVVRALGSVCVLSALDVLCACAALWEAQRPLPERNKDACRAWYDHLSSLPCDIPSVLAPSAQEREFICDAVMLAGETENSPLMSCDLTGYFQCLIAEYACVDNELAIAGEILDEDESRLLEGGAFFNIPPGLCESEVTGTGCPN